MADDPGRAARRRTSIVLVVLAPFVGAALVRFGLGLLDLGVPWLTETLGGTTADDPDPVFAPTQTTLFSVLGGLIATLWVLKERFSTHRIVAPTGTIPTTAASAGHPAAAMTSSGSLLQQLPAGYTVLSDLRLPGRDELVDHVVVGPTGVFTVESRHYDDEVTVRAGRARTGGRPLDTMVDDVRRRARDVSVRIGVPVTPIVFVGGAGVRLDGLFTTSVVDGVRFCDDRRLLVELRTGPETVSPSDVHRIAAVLVVG